MGWQGVEMFQLRSAQDAARRLAKNVPQGWRTGPGMGVPGHAPPGSGIATYQKGMWAANLPL